MSINSPFCSVCFFCFFPRPVDLLNIFGLDCSLKEVCRFAGVFPGTGSCSDAFITEQEALPHPAAASTICSLRQSQFPFCCLWLCREVPLVRQTVFTASCPYVRWKSPVIQFMRDTMQLPFFFSKFRWLSSRWLNSQRHTTIETVFLT